MSLMVTYKNSIPKKTNKKNDGIKPMRTRKGILNRQAEIEWEAELEDFKEENKVDKDIDNK